MSSRFAGFKQLMTAIFTGRMALISNTVSSGLLFVAGDAIEQRLEVRSGLQKNIDKDRLKRIGIIGLAEGPPHHYFYKYLDVLLPGRAAHIVTKKILADQLIACPFSNFQFFVGMAWLEGNSLRDCWNEFVRKFPTVYFVDWCLWPPCQVINFWLVPSKYRVLYINCVTVVWNVFLSYMKHYDKYGFQDTHHHGGGTYELKPVDSQPATMVKSND